MSRLQTQELKQLRIRKRTKMRKRFISKTGDATLWEIIGFPLGFIIGIVCSVIITVIIKGWSCVA